MNRMTMKKHSETESSAITTGYSDFLQEVKARVQAAQVRASVAVNSELVLLYWSIGRDILARQQTLGWGAKVIDQLAADLRRDFPEMQGFSPRNLKYMRSFADAWPDESIVQGPLAQITWYHNITLLEKIKEGEMLTARQTRSTSGLRQTHTAR